MLLAAGAMLLSSCAYYNTFYLAKKYYERGAGDLPYPVEKATAQESNEYRRSIDYSKKLLSQYPNSKWVDNAYLLWARALLGRDDPLQTVNMLEEFNTRFPDSPLRDEAQFYLGVGYRNARKYRPALAALDSFVVRAPRHPLVSFAHLERSRALSSLERYREAGEAASIIVDRFPKSALRLQAYTARAEARLANGDFEAAQADFRALGDRSRTDEERLGYLLREADCLEAARDYDRELALLEEALSYEIEPVRPDSGAARTPQQQGAGFERFGRILIRIGTVHLLAGRLDEAVASYRRVVEDYPKTALGAEGQYRIGYAYETLGDDFDVARAEYDKVKDQIGATGFGIQAVQRAQNLARLEHFRTVANDSTGERSEAGFVLAEQYLFQLDKPERGIEEYRKIAREYAGTPVAAKALTAEAWVLARKMKRQAAADSLLWRVVREYPATESQLAARDFLEASGHIVPDSLIKLPVPPQPSADEIRADSLARVARADSLARARAPVVPAEPGAPAGSAADSLRRHLLGRGAPFDSGRTVPAPVDTTRRLPAGIDTTFHAPAPPDTSRFAPPDPGGFPQSPGTGGVAPDSTGLLPGPGAPPDSTGQNSAATDSTRGASGSGSAPDSTSSMDLPPEAIPRMWSVELFGITLQSSRPVPAPWDSVGEARRSRRAAEARRGVEELPGWRPGIRIHPR
jgi:tetratricopeptide (TPR) repeat protein